MVKHSRFAKIRENRVAIATRNSITVCITCFVLIC